MDTKTGLIIAGVVIVAFIYARQRTRARYAEAFAMGRVEHAAGRLLGLTILITLVMAYYKLDMLFIAVVDLLLWGVYIIFHNLEKWFFPKHKRIA